MSQECVAGCDVDVPRVRRGRRVLIKGLRCDVCGAPLVILKEKDPAVGHLTRRRECKRCHLRYTTSEKIVGRPTQEELDAARQRLQERHDSADQSAVVRAARQIGLFAADDSTTGID